MAGVCDTAVETASSAPVPTIRVTSPDVEEIFRKFDIDKDGYISNTELEDALWDLDAVPTEGLIKAIMEQYCRHGNNQLDLVEFDTLVADFRSIGNVDPETLLKTFNKMDKDNSGFIDVEELKQGLQEYFREEPVTEDIVQTIMEAVDKNKDGKISIVEFVNLLDVTV
ncbi:CALML3 [Branchiostoma lanceolatum]|uniref:CALML3 protein n=1 Tax=Branchiostoma lanceolatum TaxID=7740 RepID=A0A8K0E8N3_BRALA|nr:CALML3 [Branchiostoma lanceolatum]